MSEVMKIPRLRFPEFDDDWFETKTKKIAPLQRGFDLPTGEIEGGKYPVVYSNGVLRYHNEFKVNGPGVVTGRSGTIGKVTYVNENFWPHNTSLWVTDFNNNNPRFIYYFYLNFKLDRYNAGSTVPTLNRNDVHFVKKRIPSLPEQQKIADFLTAVDTRIELLEKKKTLLETYKKGVMKKIFNQEIRFKDDNGSDFPDWEEMRLGDVSECLDNQRKPLNDSERQNMKGDIPYWGANNIMDYINEYIFNEPIVLLAEDGGNFNDFKDRPIANYYSKKCWVNNHTHVLKGRKDLLDTKFLFFSVVHKNIIGYVSGGTRSKLTKSEMLKIPLGLPCVMEQKKISEFLSSIEHQIELLETQIDKSKTWKKGLLQKMFV